MTGNIPLDADDEMYREVEYCVTMEYKAPNGEPAKSRIDRLMKMILADRKKHELLGAIKESERHIDAWGRERTKVLKQELESYE